MGALLRVRKYDRVVYLPVVMIMCKSSLHPGSIRRKKPLEKPGAISTPPISCVYRHTHEPEFLDILQSDIVQSYEVHRCLLLASENFLE